MDRVQPVREFISRNFLFGKVGGVKDDESFLESGIIDSTGVLELVTFLESTYDIKVADEELVPENLDSIQNVSHYLGRKLG